MRSDGGAFILGLIGLVVLVGLVLLAAAAYASFIKSGRPDTSDIRPVAGSDASLPDDFERFDLPFGAFRHAMPLTTFQLEHVARGPSPFGGRQWTFRYRVRVRMAHQPMRHNTAYLSCALVEVPRAWPYIGIERRQSGTVLGIPVRSPIVDLDDRRFTKQFVVRSGHPSLATAFVGDEVRRWMLDKPGLAFLEINAGYAVVVFDSDVGAKLLPRLMTWTLEVLERTPLSIWPDGERRVEPPAAS